MVLREFGSLSTNRDFNAEDLEILKDLTKVFKLPLPPNLDIIVSETQKKNVIETMDRSGSSMYPSESFKPQVTPELSESAMSFKTGAYAESSNQIYMTSTQLFELSTEEKWNLFQKSLRRNEVIKAHCEQEPESLTNTMINFAMSYNSDDYCDMMIYCEDLCSKIVECIEFWVQHKLSRDNVAFMLNILGRIIKATKTQQDKTRVQDMLNRLSLVRILVKLFTQESDYDTQFMYQILELLALLLSGGNRVEWSKLGVAGIRLSLLSERTLD